ncbi:MAG: O-antigen ligase family protein [bacterium]
MTDLVIQILIYLSLGLIVTFIVWPKVSIDWLSNLCRALVWASPFERIPSIKTVIGNIRPSQILVLVGMYILGVLILKKDKVLLNLKLNQVTFWIAGFFVVSLTSWFFVSDWPRFTNTMIANLIVFGALFLLANFAKNIPNLVRELVVVLVLVALFGIFQFAGDMLGIPASITGIIQGKYSKEIFGLPRVHGTAFEPTYFAAILATGIIALLVYFLAKKKLYKALPEGVNVVLLAFLIISFVLTFSKAGFLALPITVSLLLVFTFKKLNFKHFLIEVGQLVLGLGSFALILVFSVEKIFIAAQNFYNQALGTANGDTASALERSWFFNAGAFLLEKNPLWGVGSGQFGVLGNRILEYTPYGYTLPGSYIITQNVYLEVWLEFGLIPFFIFLWIMVWPILKFFYQSIQTKDWYNENILAGLILSFSLLTFYIQWFFFSPLYIMPIFILMGLLWNLTSSMTKSELSANN